MDRGAAEPGDPRVRAALEHWGPRFTLNGVDPSDFRRVVASVSSWSQWCAVWCEAASEHEQLGQDALGQGRNRSAGVHLSRAAVYYHFAKFVFVEDLDQMRAAHLRAVDCLNRALPHLDPPGRRVEIPFEQGQMVGILRLPAGEGPHPAVLLIAGLDSTKEEFRSTEQLFLARGMATFAVDGPGQGEAEYELRARPDWEVPGAALLDALCEQPGIDARRIGVWGVSLGGYYAARLASSEERLRACIDQAGPYDWGECWPGLSELSREAFRVRTGSATQAQARELASTFTLEGRTGNLRLPLQIIFGKQDRMIPWQQAQRLADEAPGEVELLMFEDGNHVCTNIPYRHRLRSADWMCEHLH
ncbi:MAG: alpha/beta hydrolase family protein [Candidatus Dormibacteria bacterium]